MGFVGIVLTIFIVTLVGGTILLLVGLIQKDDKVMSWIGVIMMLISLVVLGNVVPETTIVSDTYYLPCELVAINNNTKFFEDEDGNIWTWEDDLVYNMDALYLLTMNTNETKIKSDDIIQVVWQLGGEEVDSSVG